MEAVGGPEESSLIFFWKSEGKGKNMQKRRAYYLVNNKQLKEK